MKEKRERIFHPRDPQLFRWNGNGNWLFRGSVPGVKGRPEYSLGTENLPHAKIQKLALIEKLSRTGYDALKLTAGPVMLDYLKDREAEFEKEELREATIKEDRIIIKKHLEPYFDRFKLADIDTYAFLRYCQSKKKKMDFSNHRKIMGTFLRHCVRKKFLKFAPELEIPKWKRRERQPFTNEEIKRLFESAPSNISLYIMMYLFMGMRNSEIVKLEWSRVDLENKVLWLTSQDTKTKKARAIPINREVYILLSQRKLNSKSPFVFPNNRDQKRAMHKGGFRKTWCSTLAKAGIDRDLTPHDLRATWQKWTHINPNFTDTQREKMAGSRIDVQKEIYVKLDVESLRGLEEAVQIEGLSEALSKKFGLTPGLKHVHKSRIVKAKQ